jgi:ATP-binding cassette subfamily F protein 3
MISINNLEFHFGGRTLYENASLHIKPKDRIGLIGPNGAGKSTLLRLIVGEYKPDGGSIQKSNDTTIGFLNQDLLSYQSDDSILLVAMQAFERALKVQAELDVVLAEMEANYTDALLDKMTNLQEEFERLDGYTIQAKASEILEGLGFNTADLERPLRTFSGGWRMRVMLAKLLLQNPSLLLLDEPTNHLDLPSIEWIENYLQRYEGAIIIVSHDRFFLDRAVNTIVEVANQTMTVYVGNYSNYIVERAERREIQQSAYDNQQAQIRQAERFIDRFKAKASKAKQVQSKVKALGRIEMIDEVIDENAKVYFKFNFATQSGRHVCQLEKVSKNYGDLHILNNTSAIIERGDKIALIGANGKGKSTLLRIIAGAETVDGERILGHNVNDAFFAQHQLESLNIDSAIIDELKQMGSAKSETELRTILGCFLFTNDDVFKKIKVLSGGEKSRVALAKTLISEANFLLLDEPTNHLDIQSVNILIQALQQYQGTYVVVSHDRFFVSQIANKIWFIEDQEIKQYPGTFEEYEEWLERRKAQGADKVKLPVKDKFLEEKPVKKQEFNAASEKQIRKEITEIEATITKLESEKAATELKLTLPDVYTNPAIMKATQAELASTNQKLEKAVERWESLNEQLETAS